MFKTKQIVSLIRATVFSIGCAAITFGAQTNLQATGQKMSAHISHAHGGSTYRGHHHHHRHHHHRRTSSHQGKRRVPRAKSLKNESY